MRRCSVSTKVSLERLAGNMSRAELAQLAFIDPLTDLWNRRGFDRRLQHRSQIKRPVAMLMIDIDHFKRVNDTLGHDAGDSVLRNLAAALTDNLRGDDQIVSRWGGEEFIVLLPYRELLDVAVIANRLRFAVQTECGVTISIGIAIAGADRQVDSLRQLADEALYEAKEAGRNRIRCRH